MKLRDSFGSYILLFGLAASQAFPTFAFYLGNSYGNFIPLSLGSLLCTIGLAVYISAGRKIRKTIFLLLVIYLLASLGYIALTIILSPYEIVFADFSDLAKIFSAVIFFLTGYMYSQKVDDWTGGVSLVLGLVFVISFALWISILVDPLNSLYKLYAPRNIGGLSIGRLRFPGIWSYPYDSSFIYLLISGFAILKFAKNRLGLIATFFCLVMSAVFIIHGQSRISLVALFIATILIICMYMKNAPNVFGLSSCLANILLALIMVGSYILVYQYDLLSYVGRVEGFFEGQYSSVGRLNQIQSYYSLVSEEPLRLLFGFGPSRGSSLRMESGFEVVYRYGLLGGPAIFFFFPLVVISCLMLTKYESFYHLSGKLKLYILSFVLLIIHHVSSPLITHYRLIPIFMFLSGAVLYDIKR